MQFLITNAETYTDREKNTVVHLWGRDSSGDRSHVEVHDYKPHIYVRTAEVRGHEQEFLGEHGILGFDHDSGFTEFGRDEPLSRVTIETPRSVRDACDAFDWTGGADVTLDNWLRIERGVTDWVHVPSEVVHADDVEPIEPPIETDPEPRVVTLDIEVDDRGGFPDFGEKRITSIVAHDSYEGEYTGFIDLNGRDVEACFPDGKPEEVDVLHYDPDERRMLNRFAGWIASRDPDVLTAWNGEGFDFPYLVARMREVGASAATMSPLGEAYVKGNGTCRIRGRSVYCLLEAYKNNSWGELRSYSLDYVAGAELNASKLSHEEGYFEMWADNPTKLINYNARDVRLTVGINETAGTISFRDTLRKQIGVTFEQTRNNYQFIEMMARRKLYERREVGPTAAYDTGSEKYEGAVVFPPHSGVAENVVGIDVNSLYPWTMFMLNTSPDTQIESSVADAKGIPYCTAPSGVSFRLDRDGLFKELVEDAIGLKSEYGDLKDAAPPGSVEQAVWEEKYQVSKTICNSIYGVCGWSKFFLYDRSTAEAITLAGQAVIKETAKYVSEETIGEVIYGDTDSNYVSFPDSWNQYRTLDDAHAICAALEEEIYPNLGEEMGVPAEDCKWRIGPEMFAPRFLMWGRKKKYSYISTWKEGMDLDAEMDEPALTIKGSAAKRSDASRLTRDTEKRIIESILHGASNTEIAQHVYTAGTSLDPDNPDWENIGIPGGIGKEPEEYEKPTAHVEAAMNSNELLGTDFGKGSKPMRCYIRPTYVDALNTEIDRIAYEDAEEIEGSGLVPDVGRMSQTLIVNPLEPLLDAVDIDVNAAIEGQLQTGLNAFF